MRNLCYTIYCLLYNLLFNKIAHDEVIVVVAAATAVAMTIITVVMMAMVCALDDNKFFSAPSLLFTIRLHPVLPLDLLEIQRTTQRRYPPSVYRL